ncbi:MAG: tail fiber protein [Solirubrobacteraceae bacterium]|nr:tail fiber protein [Solirubrobacteraceae bacterium]
MPRTPRLLFAFLAALLAATAASPAPAAPLPGVPADASLLFTVGAQRGTLRQSGGALHLTLRGVDRRATWFTDRPDRNAGHVLTSQLVGAWSDLDFARIAPNAALVIDGAHRSRDTIALELRRPAYDRARRTLRFTVRRLAALGPGLPQLHAQLDRRIPRRFGRATLFIDNAGTGATDCTVGQLQLMATDRPVRNMLPADGRTLPSLEYLEVASIFGSAYGGDVVRTTALPNLPSPAPGTTWYACVHGRMPREGDLGPCTVGEVDLWRPAGAIGFSDPGWVPADGRTLTIQDRLRAERVPFAWDQMTVTLPNLAAPQGLTWMACVAGTIISEPVVGQIDLFAGEPPRWAADWIPADGRTVSADDYPQLDAVINGTPTPEQAHRRFAVPDVPSPAPGLQYYNAATGEWPLQR